MSARRNTEKAAAQSPTRTDPCHQRLPEAVRVLCSQQSFEADAVDDDLSIAATLLRCDD
jgi:hypothetical protein